MATPNQKADARPISFVLHNMAAGTAPVEVGLVIRPEDLVRSDASRLTTTQTLGGAWTDNFGPGVPTLQISGHTGWGAGSRANGLEVFQRLHDTIFNQWHAFRAQALTSGRDPDLVKLIFLDKLDQFEWVVAPQSFVLRRNKSRPLLSQYQIGMTWLSNDVAATKKAMASSAKGGGGLLESLGLDSLLGSLKTITDSIQSGIMGFLGPIKDAVGGLVKLTANVLKTVTAVINTVKGAVDAVTSGLMSIAGNLARAAANVTQTIVSIMSLPQQIKAKFQRVGAAFNNAFCVIRNIFKSRKFIPNFDSLYGASNCSSTAGGRPISKFATENPFPVFYPLNKSGVNVSTGAQKSMANLANSDPVMRPMSLNQIRDDASAVVAGVVVA